MFDHIYILADGQCAYEGKGQYLVDYLNSIGLSCPLTYNPADFSKCLLYYIFNTMFSKGYFLFIKVIDVSSGEYGKENVERLVNNVKNDYCYNWRIQIMEDRNLPTTSNTLSSNIDITDDFNHDISLNYLKAKTTSWQQFEILYRRRTFQIFRNTVTIKSE